MEATITSKGQITIPKKLREHLGLEEGKKIIFLEEDEKLIILPKKDPLERLKHLRNKVKLTEKDLKAMMVESKRAWNSA